MTRAAQAAVAATLKRDGLNGIQIAERMGISRSYAYALLNDPTGKGDRQRKERYRGECVDCGQPTNRHNGPTNPPRRCDRCARVESGKQRTIWTREAIVAAGHRWIDQFGEPPATYDWFSADPAQVFGDSIRAARYREFHDAGLIPGHMTVFAKFGSWTEFMRALGYEPRPAGGFACNHRRKRRYRDAA